jgi:tripartite-type tricarboxylate transporter receptor subunit TctC
MEPRLVLPALAVASGLMLSGNVALAAEHYPTRHVEIVVPMAPGGTTDVCVRILSEALSKELGVAVVVTNKAGGSGASAADYVAKAPPDGYTLLATTNTVFVTLPLTMPGLSYKPADFTPIMRVASSPLLIFTKGESPFNSMTDVATFAKKNPGKLNCGIVGAGSTTHFEFELWRDKAGVDIEAIPYQGGGPLLTAQLGGHVDFGIINLPPIYALAKSGKVKILASTDKLKEFPQIPTFAEIGCPECNIGVWVALVAPPNTHQEIADKIAAAVAKVLKNPSVIEKLEKLGYAIEALDARAFSAKLVSEMKALQVVRERITKNLQEK